MSRKGRTIDRDNPERKGPLKIEAELTRVQQRASARLGTGIGRRALEVMLSKLGQIDEEKNRGD